MKWFILFVGVVVVCFVAALLLGLASGGMGGPGSSLSHEPLPDDELHDDDLDELTFDVTARGYRMSQVDGVIDRLRRELRERDAELAVLRGDRVRDAEPVADSKAQADAEPAGVELADHESADAESADAAGPGDGADAAASATGEPATGGDRPA